VENLFFPIFHLKDHEHDVSFTNQNITMTHIY